MINFSVKKYLQTDPAIKAGRFNLEIFTLKNLCGSICKYIEPIEMVTYKFARVKDITDGFDFSLIPEILKLYEGEFTDNNERILILEKKKEIDDDKLKKPFEKKLIYMKDLWIAKGTFCE